jgi:A/G-specific adenine glycosylase
MAVDLLTDPFAMSSALLLHYNAHARALPWRAPPDSVLPDPYRVWLSEIMLQQTTVAAVIPYFERFTARWPSVQLLAAAQDEDVMSAWAGLGYYARARNLLACARAVTNDYGGHFPDSEAGLRALPGIGAYTAAAIAAIAFGRRAVVVDGNVERVIARLAMIDMPLPAAKPIIRALADALTPDTRAGDFAQAMMDLGATICTPRSPNCAACPLSLGCRAKAKDVPTQFPVKTPKRAKMQRHGLVWWIERDGAVWLVRRPAKGLLGGMRALPGTDWTGYETPLPEAPPLPGRWRRLARPVTHIFTHVVLDLHVMIRADEGALDAVLLTRATGPGEWWPDDRLDDAGLPSLYARAVQAVHAD